MVPIPIEGNVQYGELSIEFIVDEDFKEFILPINKFEKSSFFLANTIKSKNITSIGLVAYGRDHHAKLNVKEIAFLE